MKEACCCPKLGWQGTKRLFSASALVFALCAVVWSCDQGEARPASRDGTAKPAATQQAPAARTHRDTSTEANVGKEKQGDGTKASQTGKRPETGERPEDGADAGQSNERLGDRAGSNQAESPRHSASGSASGANQPDLEKTGEAGPVGDTGQPGNTGQPEPDKAPQARLSPSTGLVANTPAVVGQHHATVHTRHTVEDVPQADVVIALGVRPEGAFTPSSGMMSNLLTAITILNSGKAKYLMVCGGYTRGHIAEAEMMAIIAQALGVTLDRILVENGSVDTEENARNAALIAGQRGFGTAILVAQEKHVDRAAGNFVDTGAFSALFSVVGLALTPEFQPAAVGAAPGAKPEAIVVHGVSPGFDFTVSPLAVPAGLVSLLSAASGLYRQYHVPLILWHNTCPHGHITRSEVMAIILASMGVPEKQMVLGSARRYQQSGLNVVKLCQSSRAKRVLALMLDDAAYASATMLGRKKPRDLGGPDSAAKAREAYAKGSIEATLVFVEPQ